MPFCIFSCKESLSTHTKVYSAFEHETIANPKKVGNIEELPLLITQFWIRDGYLITYDRLGKSKNYFFVFDMKSKKLLSSFGKIGGGPGETAMSNNAFINLKTRKIYQPAYDKLHVYEYDLDSAINLGPSYLPSLANSEYAVGFRAEAQGKLYFIETPFMKITKDDTSKSISIIRSVGLKGNDDSEFFGKHFKSKNEFTDVSTANRLLLGNFVLNNINNKTIQLCPLECNSTY